MALSQHELIGSLVPDPSKVPDLKIRSGYLGNSANKDAWRLYRSLNLTEYIEFAKRDVLHTVSLESDVNPLGRTIVFLKRDAEVTQTRTTHREAQAGWLSGDITRDVMHRIGGFSSIPGGPVPFNPTWILISIVIIIDVISRVSDNCDNGGGGGNPDFTLNPVTICNGVGSC